jgi:hypothetical protein
MARTKNNRSGSAYKMKGFPKHATTSPLHNEDESWLEWGKRKFKEGKQKFNENWENLSPERQEQLTRLAKTANPIGWAHNTLEDLTLLKDEGAKVIKGEQTFKEGKDKVLDHVQKHMELPGMVNPVVALGDAAISKARGKDEEAKSKATDAIISKVTKPVKLLSGAHKAYKANKLADDIKEDMKS